jgi:gluconokinase
MTPQVSGEAATIVVIMGVSGVGKTTIGRLLSERLGWTFVEGDDLHPAANVQKMRRGEPLDDADRAPWLRALRRRIDELATTGRSAVVACSALKAAYRDVLARGRPELRFVWLVAPPERIVERLRERRGHFMPAALLASQHATLEPPDDAIRADATRSPEEIVTSICRALDPAPADRPVTPR